MSSWSERLSYKVQRSLRWRYPEFFESYRLATPWTWTRVCSGTTAADVWVSSLDLRTLRLWGAQPSARRTLRPQAARVAAWVVELPTRLAQALAPRGWFVVPAYLEVAVDLRTSWQPRKDIARRLKQLDADRLELTVDDPSVSFRDFYEDFYVPSLQQRHGRQAFVRSPDYVLQGFRDGSLLSLRRDGKLLALALNLRHENDRTLLHWAGGVRNGDAELVKAGLDSALIYHSLRWAQRQPGIEELSLANVHPFGKNGLLRFKSRWGELRPVPGTETSYALCFADWSPELRTWLSEIEPVVSRGNELCLLTPDPDRAPHLERVFPPGLDQHTEPRQAVNALRSLAQTLAQAKR